MTVRYTGWITLRLERITDEATRARARLGDPTLVSCSDYGDHGFDIYELLEPRNVEPPYDVRWLAGVTWWPSLDYTGHYINLPTLRRDHLRILP